ncbi:MAG: hypothetical protein IKM88_14850, partial [Lachnospiraceae bacterium]|nr:hypothetical protein [Lachnospiraceae bacterium]
GEIPDDDINVEFPKTPAEKMRITLIALAVFLALVGIFFLVKYLIVPAVSSASEKAKNGEKVEFLVSKMEENEKDPEVSAIFSEYQEKYGK